MLELVFQHDSSLQERPADAKRARSRLIEGNARFSRQWLEAEKETQRHVVRCNLEGMSEAQPGVIPKQQPYAAVLSCSDARVPTELLFHQTLNDMFVVRLAGNVITNESIGSLNYAAQHLGGGVKLMVVLGHTGCGAVGAAVDAYIDPANAPAQLDTVGLRSVVDRIFVAVRTAARALEQTGTTASDDPAIYRARLTGVSIFLNAAVNAMTLHQILGPSVPLDCQMTYGVYDIATRQVLGPDGPGLADPPSSFDELHDLAIRVAQMDRW